MLRKRLLFHASLVVLFGTIGAVATISPVIAATSVTQKTPALSFTFALSGPGDGLASDRVCIGTFPTWYITVRSGIPDHYDWKFDEEPWIYNGPSSSYSRQALGPVGWHSVTVDGYEYGTLFRWTERLSYYQEYC